MKSHEKYDVTLVDVMENLQKYRSSLEFITESFELRQMNPEAQTVRVIAEAMEVTEEMLRYIMTAPRVKHA